MGEFCPIYKPHSFEYTLSTRYDVQTFDFQGVSVASASVDSFTSLCEQLDQTSLSPDILLTPELVTCTDICASDLSCARSMILERNRQIRLRSRKIPNTTIILGSPIWGVEGNLPRNGCIFIKDGQTVGYGFKRTNVNAEEYNAFNFSPIGIRPITVPGFPNVGVFICADYRFATFDNDIIRNTQMRQFFREKGKYAILQYSSMPQMVLPEWNSILLMSSWGIGATQYFADQNTYTLEEYYAGQLLTATEWLFRANDNIQKVVTADRAVSNPDPEDMMSTIPYNLYAVRKMHNREISC